MTTVAKGLAARLTGDVGVAALVGDRVRKGQARQDDTAPYIVFHEIFTEPLGRLDQPAGTFQASYQVDCWAETRHEAATLGAAVRDALDYYQGHQGGIFLRVFFDRKVSLEEVTLREQPLYADSNQFRIWHPKES